MILIRSVNMIRRFQFILLSFLTVFLIVPTAGCSNLSQTGQFPQKVLIDSQGIEYLDYLLFLPSNYYKEGTKKWPMILFLHGRGERGKDIEVLRKAVMPTLVEENKDFPFIVVSPLCPGDRYWEPLVLKKLLDDVSRKLRIDTDRIYLTGLSMGGFGTWNTAIKYPDIFAAIAPVCGGGNPGMVCSIGDMPVWVFHGAKDTTIYPQESVKMVEALENCGGNVKFTLYPELEHDCWTETYNNTELYEWFLEQSK